MIIAVGFTVMVNVLEVPEHPFANGIIVIVATTGAVPLFTAVKAGRFPTALALNPIEGVSFVHV